MEWLDRFKTDEDGIITLMYFWNNKRVIQSYETILKNDILQTNRDRKMPFFQKYRN